MAQVEAINVVLPDDVMEQDIAHLKTAWQEALDDKRPGVAPGPVFRRVREKFATGRITGS
jgi:hypothetical protein